MKAWQRFRASIKANHPKLWESLRISRLFAHDLKLEWRDQGARIIGKHLGSIIRDIRLPRGNSPRSRRIWLDLGQLGSLRRYNGDDWQDHGLGLLRTILHQNGLMTELASVRNAKDWDQVAREIRGYDMLLMNVRSYNFDVAVKAAAIFKQQNPGGRVLVGGIHTIVSPESMEAVPDFDRICRGPGEGLIVDLVRDPDAFPRMFPGKSAASMGDWPDIDRTLWPKPAHPLTRFRFQWPMERGMSWGPQPQATLLTSRVCPWACSFCNEASYIQKIERKPVEKVIDELNALDEKYGFASVTIHDSMFFQNPTWLEKWLELYPRRARRCWPYWAAARADTVLKWPDLFEALVKKTNWKVVSIGFEANSDRMLRVLNKQVTKAENEKVVGIINRIGDEQEKAGVEPVKLWANIMFAIPGETREEAFETYRIMKKMRRAYPSVAFYTAYPGSALGFQLIAEGKDQKHIHVRDAVSEPIKGIDYAFYRALLRGEFESEVNRTLTPEEQRRAVTHHSGLPLHELFGGGAS